jgi:serine/threonine protein kinase
MIGKTISHYRILEKLGEGGMGVVYKARDTHLDRFVAIKVLPAEKVADPERKRRFVQEAKAASALNHPNIITIYDIDQTDGVDFIVMEHVQGRTLDALVPHKGLRLNETLRLTIQMADALAKAHSAGIVHRDLKPTNVMVTDDGLVKVLDFGLAKLTEVSDRGDERTLQSQTDEGTIVGTVSYMSPEQAEGKKVDARSDIFSFGSVLYEMATGQQAFHGDSKMSTLAAIMNQEPKPISQLVPGIPRDLEKIIVRCVRKAPERRWQFMADIKVALTEMKEESESGSGVTNLEQVAPQRWRSRWIWATAFSILVLAIGGTSWWYWIRPSAKISILPMKTLPFTSYPSQEITPAFSPDGNQVAFAWNGENGDNYDIYVKLIDGGTALPLTTNPADEYSPAWSPDGRRVAFLRVAKEGQPTGSSPPASGRYLTNRTLRDVWDVMVISAVMRKNTLAARQGSFCPQSPGKARKSISLIHRYGFRLLRKTLLPS